MTSEQLSLIAGALMSLAFSYVPGLKAEYEKLDPTKKRGVMALSLLAVAIIIFGLSCGQIIDAVACTKDAAVTLATNFLLAMIANQGTFQLTPKKQATVYAQPLDADEQE